MEKIIFEYSILRYVPDIERGEHLNVGLLMMSKRYRWLRVAVEIDRTRLSGCFPNADLKLLESQLEAYKGCDIPDACLPVEERYRWMAAVKSAIIQTSPSHPGLILTADSPTRAEAEGLLNREFDRLVERLCR